MDRSTEHTTVNKNMPQMTISACTYVVVCKKFKNISGLTPVKTIVFHNL